MSYLPFIKPVKSARICQHQLCNSRKFRRLKIAWLLPKKSKTSGEYFIPRSTVTATDTCRMTHALFQDFDVIIPLSSTPSVKSHDKCCYFGCACSLILCCLFFIVCHRRTQTSLVEISCLVDFSQLISVWSMQSCLWLVPGLGLDSPSGLSHVSCLLVFSPVPSNMETFTPM